MTAARGERPSATDVSRRIRVLGDKVFAGRLGTIVETKVKGRGVRLRVQLDDDAGYSWWFAAKELEVLPPYARASGVLYGPGKTVDGHDLYTERTPKRELEVLPDAGLRIDSDPVRAAGAPGASRA